MCGICGFAGEYRPKVIERMLSFIQHRGPDDGGAKDYPRSKVCLGHRRLSILDLSPLGYQPMSNEDSSVWTSFNGEIYNHRELREHLSDRGHVFRSQTDTEVLVHLYEEHGLEFLSLLNGMFSLAIWDERQQQLLLAKDHAGIKPLYYHQDGPALYFASEIKALLQIPGIPRRLDPATLAQFLSFLWVPGKATMLEGIKKLEPGQYLLWKDGRTEIRQWFSLAYTQDETVSEREWVERVRVTFKDSVQRQMVSDVPLGAFLSGGVDSSSIVACMRQAYPERPINCYTARFDAGDSGRDRFVDDAPYARQVAKHLGVQLKEFELKPDVTRLLAKMVWHLDEPDADPAVFPSYLISKAAREDGTTVLLSGTGGDEIFFGYRSHRAYRQYERLGTLGRLAASPLLGGAAKAGSLLLGAQHPLVRRAAKFRRGLSQRGLRRHLELVDWSSPQTRHRLLRSDVLAAGGDSGEAVMRRYYNGFVGEGEINRHSHVLIQTFLAAHNFLYTDKSSMAASVEVRVPFMDLELMRLCAQIPERMQMKGGVPKYLLKEAMAPLLPHDVLHRSKTGFMAPLRQWIATDFDPLIRDLLSPERLRSRGLFDPKAVEEIVDENRINRADHAYLIYALLNLEIWQQTFIDRPGVELTL